MTLLFILFRTSVNSGNMQFLSVKGDMKENEMCSKWVFKVIRKGLISI